VFALASGAFYRQDNFLKMRVLDGWSLVAELFDPTVAIPNIAKLLLDGVKKTPRLFVITSSVTGQEPAIFLSIPVCPCRAFFPLLMLH
jgi:hypothetical protein